jgi:hypothetical protein
MLKPAGRNVFVEDYELYYSHAMQAEGVKFGKM